MTKLLLGIVISSVFIYLSARGIAYKEVIEELEGSNCIFLLTGLCISLLMIFLKSLRLGIILSPIERIDQKRLFPITCSGNMFAILLPLRTGELVRPYLISAKSQVPLSSALAAICVERVLDMGSILFILLTVIVEASLPPWVVKAGYSLLASFMVCVILMAFMHYRGSFSSTVLNILINILPNKFANRIERFVQAFVAGFAFITSWKKIFCVGFLSVLMWGLAGLGFYNVFCLMRLPLPLVSGFVILIITTIGLTIPVAPGFLGNFHYGCILALSLFDIPKSTAVAFSLVSYGLGIGVFIILGLAFLPLMPVSFREIKDKLGLSSPAGNGT